MNYRQRAMLRYHHHNNININQLNKIKTKTKIETDKNSNFRGNYFNNNLIIVQNEWVRLQR